MRPDWAIYYTLGNFSKPVATTILPKLPTWLGKIFHFSSEILLGQLLKTFGNFLLVTLGLELEWAIIVWARVARLCRNGMLERILTRAQRSGHM